MRLFIPGRLYFTRKENPAGKDSVDVSNTLLDRMMSGIVREPSGEAARTKVLDDLAL